MDIVRGARLLARPRTEWQARRLVNRICLARIHVCDGAWHAQPRAEVNGQKVAVHLILVRLLYCPQAVARGRAVSGAQLEDIGIDRLAQVWYDEHTPWGQAGAGIDH